MTSWPASHPAAPANRPANEYGPHPRVSAIALLRVLLINRQAVWAAASLRVRSLIWATRSQATSVAAAASKSLVRRRHRPNQANLRSTTHRRGRSWKPLTPGVVRRSRWSMDRSPRAHRGADSPDRSGRQRCGPTEGISSVSSSAAAPRHGSPGRWPDEHEPREGGHWYRSQYAACGRNALSCVIAAWSAGLRGRRTLAVDHRCRRFRRASELFSRPPDKNADDPLPPARIPPCIKIALHRR